MPIQPDYVTLLADDDADSNAIGVNGTTPTSVGVVRLGGVDAGGVDRAVKVTTSGEVVVSGGTGGGGAEHVTATDTTSSISGSGGTGDVNLTTSEVDQLLVLVDVRPTVGGNDFEVMIFSDSSRTKLVYWVDQITDDIFLVNECDPLVLPDGIAYLRIKNNHASARTFAVGLTVEVRA